MSGRFENRDIPVLDKIIYPFDLRNSLQTQKNDQAGEDAENHKVSAL